MKNNIELKAALNMVLARIESGQKHSAAEWDAIRIALAQAEGYARKCRDMRAYLEGKEAQAAQGRRTS